MRTKLPKVIDDCIERMSKGQTIEACLAEYPNMRQQIEPLLRTAFSISSIPKVSPSDEFRTLSKARLMMRLRQESIQTEAAKSRQRVSLPAQIIIVWQKLRQSITGSRKLAATVTMVLLLAIAAGIWQLVGFGLAPPAPALAAPCTLSILIGSVEVQNSAVTNWQQGSDGMVLSQGSRVKTTADSHALLTFSEGSSIKLNPDTDIEIQQVEYGDEQAATIVLKQWLGSTWSRVIKMTDSGSHYQIETPSASAIVRGTLFTTTVDESGLTQITTTEGLVNVIAQGEEVQLPASQQTQVPAGMAPSQPETTLDPKAEILITIDMPAVGSVSDPTGASTGYLPSGLAYNQITGSQSSSPSDGTQVIIIPEPISGEYTIVLRYIAEGTARFTIQGKSEGEVVFEYAGTLITVNENEWLVHVNLHVDDGLIVSGTITGPEPLGDEAPENIVAAGGPQDKGGGPDKDDQPHDSGGGPDKDGQPDQGGSQGKGGHQDQPGGQGKDDEQDQPGGQGKDDEQDQPGGQGKGGDQDQPGGQGKGGDQDQPGGQGKGDDQGKDGDQGKGDDQGKDGDQGKGDDQDQGGGQGKGDDQGKDGDQGKGGTKDEDNGKGKDSKKDEDNGNGKGSKKDKGQE